MVAPASSRAAPEASTPSRAPRPAPSIARRLTVALVGLVAAASATVALAGYAYAARRAEQQLETKANEYLFALAGALEVPLWDVDRRTIVWTGRAFALDERISALRISDAGGRVYFDHLRDDAGPTLVRRREVRHGDEPIGLIELTVSGRQDQELNRRFFLSVLGLLALVVVVLGLATGLLLQLLLGRPLAAVRSIVEAYAAGRAVVPDPADQPAELLPLLRVLREMSEKLTARMAELRRAEEKYRSIFENAVEGIFQSTPDGRFLSANPAMARILGYESPAALTAEVKDLGSQVYVDPVVREEMLRRLRAGESVTRFEGQARRRDGAVIDISVSAHPVRDADGTLRFAEGTVEDVTPRKRAEAERAALEAQLRQSQKMEAIGTLAGGIAHDFNNLLTPILGHAELALSELPEGHPAREEVAVIQEAARRARDLVRQIVAFSRRSAEGPLRPVALAPLVAGVTRLLRAALPAGIEIRTELADGCGPVIGDESALHQILLNLCTNAAHAMQGRQSGVLTLGLAPAEGGGRPGRWVRLSVRDTGTGISPEHLGRIFEPYFTTKPPGAGSGLGLAVVHGIVSKLGGEVRVESAVGQGTVFEVLLPEAAEPAAPAVAMDPVPRGHGERVLVVDDEPAVRKALARLLERLGYRPIECPGAGAALEAMGADPRSYAAVLTDYAMPERNGLELADALLALRPDLPVVLATGFTEAVGADAVRARGLRGMVAKPCELAQLGQVLHRAIHGDRAAEPADAG